MKWLIDCEDVAVETAFDLPPVDIPKPSDSHVPVRDNGEPLVMLPPDIKLHPVYRWMGLKGFLRRRVCGSACSNDFVVLLAGCRTTSSW